VPGYEDDFYGWTVSTSRALAEGRLKGIDWDRVAEEIADLGKSERHALGSHLRRIAVHLLKIRYQRSKYTRSWDLSIAESQLDIAEQLEESPSLRRELPDLLKRAYAKARLGAAKDTRLPLETFPAECPFSLEEMLGRTMTSGRSRPPIRPSPPKSPRSSRK
jgi:hypothetical protein